MDGSGSFGHRHVKLTWIVGAIQTLTASPTSTHFESLKRWTWHVASFLRDERWTRPCQRCNSSYFRRWRDGDITSPCFAFWLGGIYWMYVCIYMYAVLSKRKHAHLVGKKKTILWANNSPKRSRIPHFQNHPHPNSCNQREKPFVNFPPKIRNHKKEPQKITILLGIATRYPYLFRLVSRRQPAISIPIQTLLCHQLRWCCGRFLLFLQVIKVKHGGTSVFLVPVASWHDGMGRFFGISREMTKWQIQQRKKWRKVFFRV